MNIKNIISSIGKYSEVAKILGKSERTINGYCQGAIPVPLAVLIILQKIKRGENVELASNDKTTENVQEVIKELGGNTKVANALSKSHMAVYNWSIGKSKPDDANWYLMKQYLRERKINQTEPKPPPAYFQMSWHYRQKYTREKV